MNTETLIRTNLSGAQSRLGREAQNLRAQMDNLIARLEAGGSANTLDTLGSRVAQFESALAESVTLQNVVFLLELGQDSDDPELLDFEASLPPFPASLTPEERCEHFRHDMAGSGFTVETYYHGPAVRVANREALERVLRATPIPLDRDACGDGFVVYPRF